MGDPTGPATAGPASVLEEDIATGRETFVRVASFSVADLTCPAAWDPGAGHLPTSYTVFDPNGQIQRGRLAFYRCPPAPADSAEAPDPDAADDGDSAERGDAGSPADGDASAPGFPAIGALLGDQRAAPDGAPASEPLATLALGTERLAHGAQLLPDGDCWDGSLPDGSRVSALDAPLWVRLEVWNRDTDAPPGADEDGTTAHAATTVAIAVVVSSRWSTDSVIPAGDPDEPSRGKASLNLRVRHIPDGTAVRLLVARIGDIGDPATDRVYEWSGRDADANPGLNQLTVRRGRVVDGNNRQPEVEFVNHAEHWKYPGNNFYAAYLAVGDSDRWLPVTERDHAAHEDDALHMRFTVLVHVGSSDNRERTDTIREIGEFLNNDTRYFHAAVKTTPISDPDLFRRLFRHRYMVVFLGHAYCDCWHPDHPTTESGQPIDHPHTGYEPDGLVCPDHYRSEEARREAEAHAADYAWPIQLGCGNPGPYRTIPMAGSNLMLMNRHDRTPADADYIQVGHRGANRGLSDAVTIEPADAPRFYYHCAGCRTATTDSLIGWFNDQGTRYVHGWVYSVHTHVSLAFARQLFRRWIKETGSDLGQPEWDTSRFFQVYGELACVAETAAFEPRLRSSAGRHRFDRPPDSTETALA